MVPRGHPERVSWELGAKTAGPVVDCCVSGRMWMQVGGGGKLGGAWLGGGELAEALAGDKVIIVSRAGELARSMAQQSPSESPDSRRKDLPPQPPPHPVMKASQVPSGPPLGPPLKFGASVRPGSCQMGSEEA